MREAMCAPLPVLSVLPSRRAAAGSAARAAAAALQLRAAQAADEPSTSHALTRQGRVRGRRGLEPIHRAKTINLEKHEIKALFDRGTQGTSERDTEAGERVEGMGFKPAWDHTIKPGGGSAADERMEGTGLEGGAEPGAAAEGGGGGGGEARSSHEAALDRVLDAREGGEEGRRRERKEKKHKKEKKRKKEKKHKKKHKKEKKKRQRHDSSSDSDSEGYKKLKMNARGGLRNDGGDRGVTLDARALGLA